MHLYDSPKLKNLRVKLCSHFMKLESFQPTTHEPTHLTNLFWSLEFRMFVKSQRLFQFETFFSKAEKPVEDSWDWVGCWRELPALAFVHLPLVWWKVEEWLGMQWMAGFLPSCFHVLMLLPSWLRQRKSRLSYFNWIDKLVLYVNIWQVNCTFTDSLSFIFLNTKHASLEIYGVFPHILNEFNKYLNMLKVFHASSWISI